MRRPAVFFDRDNTLIVGNDYLGDPAGVVLVAGAAGAVAQCRELGFAVVVVSNQSGVARGMFGEDAVRAVNAKMDEMLLAVDPRAVIDRHEYCPFHPDGSVMEYRQESDRRKPKPGMIHAAAEAMALDLPASWLIGDAPRDVAAGRAAGCRTILIIDPSLPPSPAALADADTPADFVVGSLIEAVEVVTQQSTKTVPRPSTPADAAGTPPFLAPDPPQAPPVAPLPPPATQPSSAAVLPSIPTIAVRPTRIPPPGSIPIPPSGPTAPARPTAAPAAVKPRPAVTSEKPAVVRLDTSRLEAINHQVLMELKKLNDHRHDDFSLSKLIAGIVQTLALAALPVAYVLYRNDAPTLIAWLLAAVFLQTFTVALLVMGRQR